jgi:hypothetical protein
MHRGLIVAIVILIASAATLGRAASGSADHPDLSGSWTLNRQLSQLPTEVGFGLIVPPDMGDSSGQGGRSGGGGRGGGGAEVAPKILMESPEDAAKVRELVLSEMTPASSLTIVQTDALVTITDARATRTFHTNGKEDIQQLAAGPIGTTAKWDGLKLVIDYNIEKDRKLRYTYTRESDHAPLVVQVQFLEKGKGDAIKRVYDRTGTGRHSG